MRNEESIHISSAFLSTVPLAKSSGFAKAVDWTGKLKKRRIVFADCVMQFSLSVTVFAANHSVGSGTLSSLDLIFIQWHKHLSKRKRPNVSGPSEAILFCGFRRIRVYTGDSTMATDITIRKWAVLNLAVKLIEGYFSILKRGINGVYHHVGKQHLHRYLSEFDFRYNSRHIEDGERSLLAIRKVTGKRLKYRDSSRP